MSFDVFVKNIQYTYTHIFIYTYYIIYTYSLMIHSISWEIKIPKQIWDHKYMDDQINLRSIHPHAITIVGKISYVLVMEVIQKNHLPIYNHEQ